MTNQIGIPTLENGVNGMTSVPTQLDPLQPGEVRYGRTGEVRMLPLVTENGEAVVRIYSSHTNEVEMARFQAEEHRRRLRLLAITFLCAFLGAIAITSVVSLVSHLPSPERAGAALSSWTSWRPHSGPN